MSYFIQSYGKGSIYRNGDKYELHEDDEVKGPYISVATLVQTNPLSTPKEDTSDKDAATAPKTTKK